MSLGGRHRAEEVMEDGSGGRCGRSLLKVPKDKSLMSKAQYGVGEYLIADLEHCLKFQSEVISN